MSKQLLNSLLLIGSLWAASGVAQASLINTDYQQSGDGLVLTDTAQNLQWLNWTLTTTYSYNDVKALLAPGQKFDGWRFATRTDLDNLMNDAGVPNPGGRTSANIPSVRTLLSGLGVNNYFSFLGAGNSSVAFLESGTNPSLAAMAVFTIETFDNPLTAKAGEIGAGITNMAYGAGSALVRVTPAAPVPVPAAFWLFASSLLAFCGQARRKMS